MSIARDYLGPVAERFIQRQIVTHLKLPQPTALAAKDIAELARWCKLSGSLVTDEKKAAAFSKRIAMLA